MNDPNIPNWLAVAGREAERLHWSLVRLGRRVPPELVQEVMRLIAISNTTAAAIGCELDQRKLGRAA